MILFQESKDCALILAFNIYLDLKWIFELQIQFLGCFTSLFMQFFFLPLPQLSLIFFLNFPSIRSHLTYPRIIVFCIIYTPVIQFKCPVRKFLSTPRIGTCLFSVAYPLHRNMQWKHGIKYHLLCLNNPQNFLVKIGLVFSRCTVYVVLLCTM